MLRRVLLAAVLSGAATSVMPVQAHDVQGTRLLLDVAQSALELELQLPLEQLSLALPGPVPGMDAAELSPQAAQLISDYVQAHLQARTRAGVPLDMTVHGVSRSRSAETQLVVLHARLEPRVPAAVRVFELDYDAIVHRVVTHNIYVFVRRDLQSALLGDEPELSGLLHYQKRSLIIDRSRGNLWRGFKAVFVLGMRHIREGSDHLLFLLMLLLPAPLLAIRGRWASPASMRHGTVQTIEIVSAFTLGHSLTLIGSTLWAAELPAQPVEIAIAVSILVSGVHAMRPVFAGREALVAAGFGLVHGLAFASALGGFGFDHTQLAISLLGFNLGVEAMQLAVVALVMPWLWLASRSRHYLHVRQLGAACAVVAAGGWLAERAFGVQTVVPKAVELAAVHAAWLAAGLAVTAAALFLLYAAPRSAEPRNVWPAKR